MVTEPRSPGVRICFDIASHKYTHARRCNWGSLTKTDPRTFRSLGPTLATGTAGLALLLAESFLRPGRPDDLSEDPRTEAIPGALRHALAGAHPASPHGRRQPGGLQRGLEPLLFLNGRLGILWTVERAVARLAKSELSASCTEIGQRCEDLLNALLADPETSRRAAVDAWGILALLDLGRRRQIFAEPAREMALRTGERFVPQVLAAARAGQLDSRERAGSALALAELAAASSEESFAAAADTLLASDVPSPTENADEAAWRVFANLGAWRADPFRHAAAKASGLQALAIVHRRLEGILEETTAEKNIVLGNCVGTGLGRGLGLLIEAARAAEEVLATASHEGAAKVAARLGDSLPYLDGKAEYFDLTLWNGLAGVAWACLRSARPEEQAWIHAPGWRMPDELP